MFISLGLFSPSMELRCVALVALALALMYASCLVSAGHMSEPPLKCGECRNTLASGSTEKISMFLLHPALAPAAAAAVVLGIACMLLHTGLPWLLCGDLIKG